MHESARDHDRISSGLGSTESDGVIDDGRDLSIETRTRRQGGSVARAVGVSLPRRAGPLFDSLLPLDRLFPMFSISPRELESEVVFFTSNSSYRRKLHRILLEPELLPVAKDPVDPSAVFIFQVHQVQRFFLRRVGRERARSFYPHRSLCRSLGARHSRRRRQKGTGGGQTETPRLAAMRRRTIESARADGVRCARERASARRRRRRRRAQRSATNLTLSGAADRPTSE